MTDHIAESFNRPPPTYVDIMLAVETLLHAGYAEEAMAVLWNMKSDEEKATILKVIAGQSHG